MRDDLKLQKLHLPNEPTIIKEKFIANCEDLRDSRIEGFLNIYETACLQYLQNPDFYSYFRDDYAEELFDIVESKYFEQYFNAATTRYNNIINFYNKNKIR
ncbi:MAG: hypothetical protein H6575_08415 [Lewinellaceae bacterium]|nr:hypothetical protein [Lewinellaceae bacterium]